MPAPSGNTSATPGPLTPTSTPPLDDLALDTAISGILAGLTGLPGEAVRPRWQDDAEIDWGGAGAQPRVPDIEETWIAVGVTDIVPDDTPVQQHYGDGQGYTVLRTYRRLNVLASFYGPKGDGYANLVRDALFVGQNRDTLRSQGLSFGGSGTIRRLPEIKAMRARRRSDLPFWLTQTVERRYEIRNVRELAGGLTAYGGQRAVTDALRTDPPPAA